MPLSTTAFSACDFAAGDIRSLLVVGSTFAKCVSVCLLVGLSAQFVKSLDEATLDVVGFATINSQLDS